MNKQQRQFKINSILNQVRKGEIEVQLYDFHYKVVKEEEIEFLRESLLQWGQIDPVYVAIEDLESNKPIVRVVKGNKLLRAINELRSQGKWNKSLYVKLYNESDSAKQSPAGFFAASNFARSNYSTMQKGVYAGVWICPGLRAQGKTNQANRTGVTTHVNTIVDAGKLVGVNEKAVKLGEKLVSLDRWFYTYIWEDQNDMPTRNVKDLLKYNKIDQRTIIEKMKELYESDKAKAPRNKSKSNSKVKSENQKTPLDHLYDNPEEKAMKQLIDSDWDDPEKTLFERALSKRNNAVRQADPQTAIGKIRDVMGGILPTKEQIQLEAAAQEAFGQDTPVEYVKQHGTGKNRIDVDFNLPRDLAETIRYACEVCGINVTIYSNPPVTLEVAA